MKTKIITLFSLLMLGGLTSQAQTLDQALNTSTTSCLATNTSNHQGQSFTCGITGNLSRIKINIISITTFGNVTMRIYNGDGTAGALLSTTNLTISNTGIQSFNIGPSIPVTAGNMYTFEIEPSTANVCSAIFMGNAYANGRRYLNDNPSATIDMWFETYVTAAGTNLTQLNATQCDQTLNGLGGSFYCTPVSGAQDYQFRFSGGNLASPIVVRRNGPWANILKSSVTGIAVGFTYNVEARAKIAGAWQPFATICTVTIAPSSCQLVAGDCNQQESATGYLYCTSIEGATNYKFRISGTDITQMEIERTGPYKNFNKASVPMSIGEVYTVEVTAKVNGTYLPYGQSCIVEINSMMDSPEDLLRFAETAAEEALITDENNFNVNAYPNPSNSNGFEIMLTGLNTENNDITLEIFDIYGKVVISDNLVGQNNGIIGKYNTENQLASGIYILTATHKGKTISQKLVIE